MAAGSTLDLGELYVKLAVDYSDFQKAEKQADSFMKGMQSAGQKLTSVGKNMSAKVTLPLVGMGAAAFKAAHGFNAAFADVDKNVKGLDPSNVKAYRTEILALGQSSLIGAEGVAALVSEGGKLGEGTKGAIEFAKAAEQMSVAFDFKGVEGAREAGNIMGKLRSSFKLSTEETLRFADAFNYFGDNTATTAKEITSIIVAQGASISNMTSFSQNELAALAASFAAVAPNAEIAATGMKNVILNLSLGAAATKKQKEAFKGLGFEAESMAKVMATDAKKGLLDVLTALKELETHERAAYVKTLFGLESMGAVSPLINNLSLLGDNFDMIGDGSAIFQSIKGEYDRLNNSDNSKFTKALNTLHVTMVKLGDVFLPILAKMATKFAAFMDYVNKLNPEIMRLAVVFGVVAAAIGPLLLLVGGLVTAIAPLGLLAAPVVAGLVAIGAALWTFRKDLGDIPGALKTFAENNKQALDDSGQAWKDFGSDLKEDGGTISKFFDNLNKMYHDHSSNSGKAAEDTKLFATSLEEFLQGWTAWIEVAGEALNDLWTILKTFGSMSAAYAEMALTGWKEFAEEVSIEFWKTATAIDLVIADIKAALDGFASIFAKVLADVILTFKNAIPNFEQAGKDLMIGLGNGIRNFVGLPVDAAGAAAGAVISKVKDEFDSDSPSLEMVRIGEDLMTGLGIGIDEKSSVAVNSAIAASEAVLEAFSQMQGGGGSNIVQGNFGGGSGGGDINDQLALEQAQYDASLALLLEAEQLKIDSVRPYHEMREMLEEKHLSKMEELQASKMQSQLSLASSFFGNMASLSKSGHKGLQSIGKAAAIAQATIDMYSAISSAYAKGTAVGGPIVGAAFAASAGVAAGVNLANIVSAKTYNNGGNIPSGSFGIAGEGIGPELISGPASVMSTQSTKELLQGKGGGNTNVLVEVFNLGSNNVKVQESGTDDEKRIKIIIEKTKESIAADASRGDGIVDTSFAQAFKLSRTG